LKTKNIILLSAAIWVGGAIYQGSEIVASVAGMGHVLAWLIHRVEVKLNRLLDAQGIRVTERELEE